ESCGNGLFEEKPHVAALAGTRAFDGSRKIQLAACLGERGRILTPASLVEIRCQKEARLVSQHRIDAGDERLASVVVARQVPPDHVIGHRKESLVATVGAPDPWLFADPSYPLVAAGRRVP